MIIKFELDIPEADNCWVQSKAQEERIEVLKDLCESYGYGKTALVYAEGLQFDPGAIEGVAENLPRRAKDHEIQLSVGGLALELRDMEKYWNTPEPFREIEREARDLPH